MRLIVDLAIWSAFAVTGLFVAHFMALGTPPPVWTILTVIAVLVPIKLVAFRLAKRSP